MTLIQFMSRNLVTEYFNGTAFEAGPNLPVSLFAACFVEVSEGVLFAGAGHTKQKEAHMYYKSSDAWTTLPELPGDGRYGTVCGSLPSSSAAGRDLVVAGGYNQAIHTGLASTLVFDLFANGWSDVGRDTPGPVSHAASLQYGDSVLSIGGEDDIDAIFQLGGTDENWTTWTLTLPEARWGVAVLLVDPAEMGCTEDSGESG